VNEFPSVDIHKSFFISPTFNIFKYFYWYIKKKKKKKKKKKEKEKKKNILQNILFNKF